MADDKKKDAEAKPGKKRAIPAIVMVVVGAIAGGAGVVTMLPPKTVEVVKEPEVIEYKNPWVKEEIGHTFNPRDSKRLATVALKLRFTARNELEEQAVELIKSNWPVVNAVTLEFLKRRTVEELGNSTAEQVMRREIQEELNRRLFAEVGKEPIARISDIQIVRSYWQ